MSGWERLALLGVGAVLVRLAACSDGGTLGDPELVAGEPTVLALGCTTEYTTTADFEDGSQEIHKSYYAEADVAEFRPGHGALADDHPLRQGAPGRRHLGARAAQRDVLPRGGDVHGPEADGVRLRTVRGRRRDPASRKGAGRLRLLERSERRRVGYALDPGLRLVSMSELGTSRPSSSRRG